MMTDVPLSLSMPSDKILDLSPGCCVSEYTGHIDGNPDFTTFLLY